MRQTEEKTGSFIMYIEQWPALALLNDTQLAALMRAIFALHGATCPAPELDVATRAVFLLMKPRFDANREKYEDICRRNRENGRKGGRPRRSASETAAPEGSGEETSVRDSLKTGRFSAVNRKTLTDSDPDPDSESDCQNLPLPSCEEGSGAPASACVDDPCSDMGLGFREFLDAYPAAHREPVGEAATVWKKLARERRLPGLPRLLQGLDAWEHCGQWKKEGGAYIPKAANFLRRTMWLSAPPPSEGTPEAAWDAAGAMARLRAAARGSAALPPGNGAGVTGRGATTAPEVRP